MAELCGAKTRSGGSCKGLPMANGRCRMHGGPSTGPKVPNNANNAVKHGFYCNALTPEEKTLWDRVEIGGIDDEIRLMKVKLFRLVKLSGSADVAELIDSAIEVSKKTGDDPKLGLFDRTEIKVKAARYGDLMVQAVAEIRKLEMTRAQINLANKALAEDADEGFNNTEISKIEVVEYPPES